MGIETEIIRKDLGLQKTMVWLKGIGLTTIPAAAVIQSGVENATVRLVMNAYIAGYTGLLAYIDRTLHRYTERNGTTTPSP